MHELCITQNMLDLVLEQAQKVGARQVGKINLVIGEMSGVIDDCVEFYFEFLSKGTIAEKAALSITLSPTTARCLDCGKSFKPSEFDWTCPFCQSNNKEIVAGNELRVDSIEVE